MSMFEPIGRHVVTTETWNPVLASPTAEIDYIDLSSIDNDDKHISDVKRVSGKNAPSRARQLVRNADVLVSTVRPNLNGVAIVPQYLDGATASTGFTVLRANEVTLSGRFLYHWVKTPAFVSDMIRKATGQSYPAVSDRIIFESLMPVPQIKEQRRIAAILDEAEALRAKRRQALAKLEALTQSLFVEVFGDFLGAEASSLQPLSTIGEIASGITKGRPLNGQAATSVPYLRVANVQAGRVDLSEVKEIEATEDEIAKWKLLDGDIVMTEGGDFDKLGRGAVWRNQISPCIHQNHIFRVRLAVDLILPTVFHHYLQTGFVRRYFVKCAKKTSNLASINMTQLKSLPVFVAPLPLQEHFSQAVKQLEHLATRLSEGLSSSDTLCSSLQYRAFRGEL